MLYYMFYFIMLMMPMLIAVAYLTLLESKTLGYSQLSKGPNVVGFYGVLQPLADGVKLFSKEIVMPSHANMFLYCASPMLALLMGLAPWVMFPWGNYHTGVVYDNPMSLLILLGILSLGMFSVILSGWSSSSKYAFLGSISAVAQMMSYEVSLSLVLMGIIITTGSLSLSYIHNIQNMMGSLLLPLWPLGMIYLVSMLAETNSAPFDLSEGESELVSGYNVEYSSMPFALFFLAEYSHIMFSSFMFAVLFMGGNNFMILKGVFVFNQVIPAIMLCLKGILMSFCFLWVSTSFPSMSYDQLMGLLWKNYLPFTFSLLWLINGLLITLGISISSTMI